MLISKTWLKKYIADIDTIEDDVLAEKITNSLAEVESIKEIGKGLEKLVAGKILEVEKHPEAEKLNVCKVDVGFDKLTIVCGAKNVRPEMMVIVCLDGGSVFSGKTGEVVTISKTELRGVESNGMICSEKELGISEDHTGIMELGDHYKPGQEIDDLLKDTIFEIENKSLTHRGDCFSHLGLAREIAAIFDLNFNKTNPLTEPVQTETLPVEISIETEKIDRFLAITMKNVKVAESPFWLKYVLKNIGIRSVNNVVDVTNYILHDLGQPIHAYDYRTIKDNKIIVREARSGEEFSALDNTKYALDEGDIVITDSKDIHGLGGVMGGKRSEITDNTEDIIIEAAQFNSKQILKTSRKLGLNTDASVRFSKGIDPDMTMEAIKSTVSIISDVANGEIASEILDLNIHEPEPKIIKFNMQEIKRLSGQTIETEESLSYLERLGLAIENRQNINTTESIITAPKTINVHIPNRRHDLTEPVDLVEEIIRIYGYEKITPVLPKIEHTAKPLKLTTQTTRAVRSQLLRLNFEEVQTYSFISEQLKKDLALNPKQLLKITNAISPELKYVRNSLIPSLVNAYQKNYKTISNQRIFEIGRVVDISKQDSEKLPYQPWNLGILVESDVDPKNLLQLKSEINDMMHRLELDKSEISWREYETKDNQAIESLLHPYRRSTLLIGDQPAGVVGEISPILGKNLIGNEHRLIFAEINLSVITNIISALDRVQYKEISKYPTSTRDISFWIKETTEMGKLYSSLINQSKQLSGDDLEADIDFIDEYSVSESEKREARHSVTFRLTIQPLNETLTGFKLNEFVNKLTSAVAKEFGIEIRE